MNDGRRMEFTLTNPQKIGQHFICWLFTDRDDLENLALAFPGVEHINHNMIHFVPFYDHEVVWLNLYEALEEAGKVSTVWYDALNEEDNQ